VLGTVLNVALNFGISGGDRGRHRKNPPASITPKIVRCEKAETQPYLSSDRNLRILLEDIQA